MTIAPLIIEPMQAKYNHQVSRLLVHGFRGKFQPLTNLPDDTLALFFEKLFDQFPAEPASQRMIALQAGEVVGSLCIKGKAELDMKQEVLNFPWRDCNLFGKWNLLKLFLSLYFLDHQPQAGECYIEDISVHPAHQGKGIGKCLLQWAQQHVQANPCLDILSLHVVEKNQRAKKLYEQMSFCTQDRKSSILRYLLFHEFEWNYMAWRKNN